MKDIIEQLNSLQIGDLVWWYHLEGDQSTVIGMVTLMFNGDGDLLWRADFPQDGEHCFWGEGCHDYAEDGMLGVVCKSDIF